MKKLIAVAFALIIVAVYSTTAFAAFSGNTKVETVAKKVYSNDDLVFITPSSIEFTIVTVETTLLLPQPNVEEPLRSVEKRDNSPPERTCVLRFWG